MAPATDDCKILGGSFLECEAKGVLCVGEFGVLPLDLCKDCSFFTEESLRIFVDVFVVLGTGIREF